MKITELLDSAQYITDHTGAKKSVVLDIAIWQELLMLVEETAEAGRQGEESGETDQHREAAMAREAAAFQRLYPTLYPQYVGTYVAIYNEQLIDNGADQVALYRRVRQQYPGKFVWIAPIKDSPTEVLYFRSPRFQNGH